MITSHHSSRFLAVLGGLLLVGASLGACSKKKGGSSQNDEKQAPEQTQQQQQPETRNSPNEPEDMKDDDQPSEMEEKRAKQEEPPPEEEFLPDKQKIEFDKTYEGKIRSPDELKNEGMEFDTQWYEFEVEKGQTGVFRVKGKDEIRPKVTLLKPLEDLENEWEPVTSQMAEKGETSVELKTTFEETGKRFITVDAGQNYTHSKEQGMPSKFYGGEGFGYTLEAEISSE
jgi:hypothetical protein